MNPHHCQNCDRPHGLDPEIVEWLSGSGIAATVLCDDCQEEKKREMAVERARIAQEARETAARDFIPERYREAVLDRFPAKIAKAFDHAFSDGVGLVFHGPSHTGKTTAAFHIISRALAAGIFASAESIRGSQIAGVVQDSFSDEPLERNGARNLLERLKRCAVLLLDDLDKIRPTEATMEFLFDLLEHRASRKLPVVITTQATGDKLAELLADKKSSTRPAAIIGRIRSCCKPVGVAPDATETKSPETMPESLDKDARQP